MTVTVYVSNVDIERFCIVWQRVLASEVLAPVTDFCIKENEPSIEKRCLWHMGAMVLKPTLNVLKNWDT